MIGMSETVVQLVGRLDSSSVARFQQRLAEASVSGTEKLLLDLSAVNFIGSAALRAILVAAKQLSASGGKLAIFTSSQIADVFIASGIDAVLPVRTSLEQARNELID